MGFGEYPRITIAKTAESAERARGRQAKRRRAGGERETKIAKKFFQRENKVLNDLINKWRRDRFPIQDNFT